MNKPEEEQFKYLEIFKKGLSGSIGKNLRTMDVSGSDNIRGITALINSGLEVKSSDIIDSFFEKIIEYYEEAANCLILLMYNCYDIPAKTSDHMKTGESEDVYSYITCYFCPMKIEKAGLAYDKQRNCISKKELRWCVEAPAFSFIYPSFEDRQPSFDKITVYTKKPTDKAFDHLISSFWGCEELSVEMQKNIFQNMLNKAAENTEDDAFTVVKNITQNVAEIIETDGENTVLTSSDMQKIFKDNLISKQYVEEVMEDKALALKAISTDKLNLKWAGVDMKVSIDCIDLLEKKIIGGKAYVTIAIDDDFININGIDVNM